MKLLHFLTAMAATIIAPAAADGGPLTTISVSVISTTLVLPAMPTPPAEGPPPPSGPILTTLLPGAETTCTTEVTSVEPHTATILSTFPVTTEYNVTATISSSGPSVVATAGVNALSLQKSVMGLVAFCGLAVFIV